MGIERVLVLLQEKNSGDVRVGGGWGHRLHNDVDVLSTAHKMPNPVPGTW